VKEDASVTGFLNTVYFRATKMVYGVEPDLTREGGSIPVTLTLQEATGMLDFLVG